MAEEGECLDPGCSSPVSVTADPMQQLLLATGRIQPSSELPASGGVGTSVAVVEPGTGLIPENSEELAVAGDDPGGGEVDIGEGGENVNGVDHSGGEGIGEGFEQEDSSRQTSSAPPCTPTSVSTAVPSSSLSSLHHTPRVPMQHVPVTAVQQMDCAHSGEDRNMSPDDMEEGSYMHDMSPEPYTSSPGPGGVGRYKCRFCSFSTTTNTHFQFHMTKHISHKVMKCSLCDYGTTDKSNFRRHKRLHVRTNPTTVLRCEKCDYTTTLARKMREHYSHAHNEDYGPSLISTSSLPLRNPSYANGPYTNLARNICSPPHVRGGMDPVPLGGGNGTFHSYLAQPHGTIQFARGNPPHLMANCVNGGFAPTVTVAGGHHFDDGRRLILREDNRMASDCLRSIANIISQPRVPATSTITSSNFYLTGSAAPNQPQCGLSPPSSHHSHLHQHPTPPQYTLGGRRPPVAVQHQGETVRVKMEPIDCDGVSDVSSSGAPAMFDRDPDRGQTWREHQQHYMEPQTSSLSHHQRLLLQPVPSHSSMDQSDEVAPSAETQRVTQSSEAASSHNDGRMMSAGDTEHPERRGSAGGGDGLQSTQTVKSEASNVGTQCSFTLKSETSSGVTVAAAEQGSEWRRVRYFVIERGVQCELLPSSSSPRRITSRTLSADSEHQSVTGSDTRCTHCGITFDDDVLFSIHIGCHSHTDPFICNVCGKKCHNKYGFYSHIMRGHQF